MTRLNTLEEKKIKVKQLIDLIEKSKTVGLVNLENLPAKQLKAVRAKLRDKLNFVFARKTLFKRALEGANRNGAKKLLDHLEKINPALLFSDLDAFELYRKLKNARQYVAAKPGQIVPEDVVIPEGPTPFTPGPAISELTQLGLKTKVEGGKIHIVKGATVVKAGQQVSPAAASIMSKLDIKPIQIGVKITHVLEDSNVLSARVLDVDPEKFAQDLKIATLNALTLAVELGFVTKETATILIRKAYLESQALEKQIAH